MPRVRVYDARDVAGTMRETFVNRPVDYETEFPFTWPPVMQCIGDSLAVAYASDKWKTKRKDGRRDRELYKHLAESRNHVFALPGVVTRERKRAGKYERYPVIGPRVSFADSKLVMPDSFAVLGFFEEANVQLYTEGTNARPAFGAGEDDGVVTLTVKHGMLGGSKMKVSPSTFKPFIFAYTQTEGVYFIIVGDELDIEKDGIVG